MEVNEEVRAFWEEEACGTSPELIKQEDKYSKDWFEEIEEYRYSVEPFIHSIAQFTRHRGKKVLEKIDFNYLIIDSRNSSGIIRYHD